MRQSSRLVFFGTEDFSGVSLKKLITSGQNVVAVVTKPDTPRGRGQQLMPPGVKKIASQHKIPVLQPEKISDIADTVAKFKPTHGILVAYGKIIPQSFIDLFPGGIINLHPSLLPKYRGPSPIESAIINGDKKTGVSLMLLTSKMDAGPVFAQKEYPLEPSTNRLELYQQLSEFGAQFLDDKLDKILAGDIQPTAQQDKDATYCKLLTKSDGFIDWEAPAAQIEKQVRAFLGFPRSQASVFGHNVIVTKARLASSASDGDLVVKCGQGYLEIQELVAPSGKTISGEAFLRGYKKA